MIQTLRQAARMEAVQTPVIPVIADLIRSTPGTISLGQGIVSYGPPREAVDALAAFGGQIEDHRYGPVEGLPDLVAVIAEKLRRENGIAVGPESASRVLVTAGGNMAFINAVLAIADPGDEIILLAPFYFNHDMAIVMAGCRTVSVPSLKYKVLVGFMRHAPTPLLRRFARGARVRTGRDTE